MSVCMYINQLKHGSTEKYSGKIYFFEKSHDFHGKLDFLNCGESKR
jgi:hypothetical protein